jgi:hypothetical protein
MIPQVPNAAQAQQNAADTVQNAVDALRQYARPTNDHMSLGWPLRVMIFLGLTVGEWLYASATRMPLETLAVAAVPALFANIILARCIRIAAQWERGVVLRFGRLHAVKGPGLIFVMPFADYVKFVDTRLLTLDIPRQKVITKDNVPVTIDGVLYFMVRDPRAPVECRTATPCRNTAGALRDVIGGMLDSSSPSASRSSAASPRSSRSARNWGLRRRDPAARHRHAGGAEDDVAPASAEREAGHHHRPGRLRRVAQPRRGGPDHARAGSMPAPCRRSTRSPSPSTWCSLPLELTDALKRFGAGKTAAEG